jgi:hypothetical protein
MAHLDATSPDFFRISPEGAEGVKEPGTSPTLLEVVGTVKSASRAAFEVEGAVNAVCSMITGELGNDGDDVSVPEAPLQPETENETPTIAKILLRQEIKPSTSASDTPKRAELSITKRWWKRAKTCWARVSTRAATKGKTKSDSKRYCSSPANFLVQIRNSSYTSSPGKTEDNPKWPYAAAYVVKSHHQYT